MKNPFIWLFLYPLVFCFIASTSYAQLSVTTDKENAQYEAGENMSFEVSASSSGTATYVIQYDNKTTPLESGTINLNSGQSTSINYSHPVPGAVFCEVTMNGQTELAGAVFSPYDIQQLEPEPGDFDAFWNDQKNMLANVPIDPVLSFHSTGSYSTTYKIDLANIDNRRVYGYISIPNGNGPFPAILNLPSYGDAPNIANPQDDMAEKGGAISMSISIHNVPSDQQDPNAYEPNDISDRDNIYMRYAILAGIRSIDYLFSRTDFDGSSLGLTGLSQGGALAIMLAGIDDRVNLLTYANPAWAEHAGLHYGKASGFPFYILSSQNNNGTTSHEEATLSATRYYDIINFAKRYDGPSLGFIAYEDVISLTGAEFAAYNQLKGDRILMHSINVGHNPSPAEYWNGRYDFFRRHFPAMLNPPFPWAAQTTGYDVNAGPDQVTEVNTAITLSALVKINDEFNPLNSVKWEKRSGPGQVNFSVNNDYTTDVSFSEEGTYILRFTALDESNLSGQGIYFSLMDDITVTVGTGGGSTTLSLNCSPDLSFVLAPGQNEMMVNWLAPAATSNCTETATIQQSSGPSNGSSLSEGNYTISYQANNSCGNATTCNFNVTIEAAPTNGGDYCEAEATAPWTEWIKEVSFSNINNTSGKDGYGNFTNQIAEVNSNQNYPFTITAAYSWQTYASYVRIWVDYNQNNTFENNEMAFSGEIPLQQGATSGPLTGSISIPADALEGSTRMRVALQRDNYPTPCGTYQYGEVEDYSVLIGSGGTGPTAITLSACPDDINLQADDISNTAIANWSVPQATTTCPGSQITVTQTEGADSGSAFPVGNHTITYEAVDDCGDSKECSFTVTVSAAPPVGGADCDSEASFPWHEWIAAVSFGDINNTSGKEGYADFTNQSSTVTSGQNYPLDITAGFSWLQDDVYLRIWIDFNQDNSFDESTEVAFSEIYYSNDNLGASSGSFQGNINIPASAIAGSAKMRIALQRDNYATACEQFTYGEVEDYTIIIETGGGGPTTSSLTVDCPADQNFTISAGGTGAAVSWNPPTATTTCPEQGINFTQIAGPVSGSELPVGTTEISYQFEDDCNNNKICTFTITINTEQPPPPPPTGDYCEAQGNKPWGQHISNVQFATINYDSGKDQYGDFTDQNTEVEKGMVYNISLQPKFSYKHFDEYFRVWIDYNLDGDFYDTDEEVFSAISPAGENGTLPDPVIGSIEIPLSALTGTTRMRIAMQRNAFADPCETFQFGEVEDYSVTINEAFNLEGEIHFLYLAAVKQNGQAQLHWDCNNLEQTDYFFIERSAYNEDFKILEQTTLNSTELSTGHLQATDSRPLEGINYYRIKQVFTDGSIRYSPIRQLEFPPKAFLNLFPNPAVQTLFIDIPDIADQKTRLGIYNQLGQNVANYFVESFPAEAWTLPLNGFSNGLYHLSVTLEDGRRFSKIFVVENGE